MKRKTDHKAFDRTRNGWFLETSVPRKLLFGHTQIKREIKHQLDQKKSWSSQYVKMEYKRSVVKTLVDIYYVTCEEDTPSDVMNYFAESFKIREVKLVLSAIAALTNEPDIVNNKEKFLVKLQTLIASAEVHLDNIVEGYIADHTGCPLAKASTKEGYQRFLQEIDCKTDCVVERFWKHEKGHLKKLTSPETKEAHKKNSGFMKPMELLEASIKNASSSKTKLKCMRVGDFVIGLEMPKYLHMLTFDRAFEGICNSLGKNVFVLPSLSKIKASRGIS